MKMRNRIIWRIGHGLHASLRFSGRYETVSWYTKSDHYTFNLDAVRVPQKYPGKTHYRGKDYGKPSGNPLGKNTESTGRIVSGLFEKEATLRILQLVRDLYSGDPIIGKFLKTLRKNRREVFQYLEDDMLQKTNNVSEHHFSKRSELLRKRFKTDDDLLRRSYWYHRLSTES